MCFQCFWKCRYVQIKLFGPNLLKMHWNWTKNQGFEMALVFSAISWQSNPPEPLFFEKYERKIENGNEHQFCFFWRPLRGRPRQGAWSKNTKIRFHFQFFFHIFQKIMGLEVWIVMGWHWKPKPFQRLSFGAGILCLTFF